MYTSYADDTQLYICFSTDDFIFVSGNEQDSEGFYFKGDTSVPCYKRERASRTLEEDWDRGELL